VTHLIEGLRCRFDCEARKDAGETVADEAGIPPR
jgi:hypothetical protein